MEVIIYAIIFIIGAFIGSFASLAVYRIPIKEDILIKHSYCPNCKEKLVLKDLIPIFSYIFLKGKCSHCGEKIRLRYLVLEVLSGILFLLFILSFNINFLAVDLKEIIVISFIAIFFISLIIIAGIDKERKKIETPIILFDIALVAIYIIYMYFLKLDIIYSVIILAIAIVFYILNKFLIKNDNNKNIANLIILMMLSKIFVNPYILLLSVALTIISILIHKKIAKSELPIAFYYIIYLTSTFIGCNFIV